MGQINPTSSLQNGQTKHKKKKTTKSIASSNASKGDMPQEESKKEKKIKPTKFELKSFYEYCKHTLNKTWQSMSDKSSEEEEVDVPSTFKSYTIQDRKIMLQQPKRVKLEQLGESYNGPKDAKKVDIANPREDPRRVYIATNLAPKEETLLIVTLKGIQRHICLEIQRFEGCRPYNLSTYHTNKR